MLVLVNLSLRTRVARRGLAVTNVAAVEDAAAQARPSHAQEELDEILTLTRRLVRPRYSYRCVAGLRFALRWSAARPRRCVGGGWRRRRAGPRCATCRPTGRLLLSAWPRTALHGDAGVHGGGGGAARAPSAAVGDSLPRCSSCEERARDRAAAGAARPPAAPWLGACLYQRACDGVAVSRGRALGRLTRPPPSDARAPPTAPQRALRRQTKAQLVSTQP
jgi:hypothetical protein